MQKLLERTVGAHNKKRVLIYGASIAVLLALIIVSAVVLNTNALSLNENDKTTVVVTGAKADATENEYDIFDGSMTRLNGELSSSKSVTVTIKVDGKKEKVTLKGTTAKDALIEAGVILFNEDIVEPSVDSPIKDGDIITVTRAKAVTVVADGKSHLVKMAKGTVEDAIDKAGVTVGEDDTVSKDMEKSIKDGMKIKISRVTYEEKTVTEVIKYKTVTSESKSMKSGKTEVTQKGVNGEKEVTYKIKYVDGEQSDKTVVSEKILKKAVDKKITVGTKGAKSSGKSPSQISWIAPPSSVKFDKSGKPTNYKKIMSGTATAYGPKDGTATSTGKTAQPGYVAVDPKVIPYGTKMYIVSADGKYNYGYAIAADTGGAARSGRILVDLYFSSNGACYDFGRRQVNIYILP